MGYSAARRAIERLYDCKMTIYEMKEITENNVTDTRPVAVVDDTPCRVSQKRLSATSEGEYGASNYEIVLYCAPEINILPGSEILITDRYGNEKKYKRSSEGFNSYSSHQEVVLLRHEKA